MYLGGAPRESESEKRLRESIRALGAETRIRMELDRATAKERRQKRLEALRVQAEQALASLEELPEVEKRRVRNQASSPYIRPRIWSRGRRSARIRGSRTSWGSGGPRRYGMTTKTATRVSIGASTRPGTLVC